MTITFKSVGHLFASAFKAIAGSVPKIEAAITKVEATQITVDTVEKVAAPQFQPITDAGYALLGEVAALLNTGGDAAAAKLADAGIDVNVINQAKQVVASVPAIVALAKAL